MKHIFPFLRPYRGKLALAMLLSATATVCDLLLPTIMSEVLDRGVRQADLPYILRCCALMLAVAAVGLATLLGGRRLAAGIVSGFSADLRADVFRRVNDMTFEEFNDLGAAALLTRSTNDVGVVSWVASMIASTLITIPVLFFGGVFLAMSKDVVLSLILLAFVPLVIAVVILIGRKIRPLHEKSDLYIDIQNDLMRERLHGIRVIRAFNREQQAQDKIADATRIMAENIINANVRSGTVSPVAVLILNLAVLLVVWAGGLRMETGASALTGGDVFAIVQYIALVTSGVVMAGFAIVMLPQAQVSAGRIGQVFAAAGLPEPNPEDERALSGDIELRNVAFRYADAAEPAIQGVSLHIRAGERVAVIGGTGSGKSTLVQLLLAFRLPTEGEILLDGAPSTEINRRMIRKNISCVLQRTAVYSGTIRHNIEMGRPGATEAELRDAAELAQLASFIDSLPEGMDYVLNEAGKNLSGGQKQRLCISRAILKDAPIYIFDDSFSALDFLTESRLRRALNERLAGRTQIVVTQRVTSAMSSDRIYVMDKGRLIDSGTHAELLARCAIYREIYASQTGGARLDK